MAYIANRPVRFDRNYAIGEVIPDKVIDPKMTAKLIGMGRIIRIPDEQVKADAPADSTKNPADGVKGSGEVNSQPTTQNATQDNSDTPNGGKDFEGKDKFRKKHK